MLFYLSLFLLLDFLFRCYLFSKCCTFLDFKYLKMVFILSFQVREGFCLRLHNALHYLFVLVNADSLHFVRLVESYSTDLHADSFLQIPCPSEVNPTRVFFAAFNRVCLCQLGAFLDHFIWNVSHIFDWFFEAKVYMG